MSTILNVLLSWVANRSAYLVALYIAVLTVANYAVGAVAKIASTISTLDGITTPTLSGSGISLSPFSLMNYVLPLDLAVTLFAAWLAFHLACNSLRIVKAWIPTVS